ncbi:MAG: HAD family hydrolase [Candidatus Eremiobacteraeota bacterium]|nr:HAD family hydrolase [Candidatus Eremiobacteraeota bacterium]
MHFGIGFDFDHTLGIDNKIERVAFLRLLDRLQITGVGAMSEEQETAAIDALLNEQRSGKYTIDEAVTRFVRARMQGVGDCAEYIRWYKETVLDTVDDFVVPLPGAVEMLVALKARQVPVALLSNGWSPLQARKAARVGFQGPVLVSDQIGTQKPNPLAFESLLSALRLPASQVFYVGDNPLIDIDGCMQVGIRSVWLDAEGIVYPTQLPKPSRTIHALSELLSVLPGPTQTERRSRAHE